MRGLGGRKCEPQDEAGYRRMSNVDMELITLERILGKENLQAAFESVVANRGASGTDGMATNELEQYFREHPYEISKMVLEGKYRPKPIKRVYIPKDNGEMRPLGIPTVLDRFIQQAIAQVLSQEYEKIFSDNSFGFRPRRSCHKAITRATEYLNEGKEWIIDLDLSKFFDTVNHSKLLQLLSDRIKDGRVISLIHRFLRAPVEEDGKVGHKTTIGTPQGGCISPVLANILLNELDQLLDSRGHKFVRYADDMVIFCSSKKGAERVLESITKFIEGKLFLKVNKEKTKIIKASNEAQFLGFSFTSKVSLERKRRCLRPWKWFPTVHTKKRLKLITILKELLNKKAPGGISKVKYELKLKLRGWVNYFSSAIPIKWMKSIDKWIRRKIRALLWKQWKTGAKRQTECAKRWSKAPKLGDFAYSSNRIWHNVKSQVIHIALSNKILIEDGWCWLEKCQEDGSIIPAVY